MFKPNSPDELATWSTLSDFIPLMSSELKPKNSSGVNLTVTKSPAVNFKLWPSMAANWALSTEMDAPPALIKEMPLGRELLLRSAITALRLALPADNCRLTTSPFAELKGVTKPSPAALSASAWAKFTLKAPTPPEVAWEVTTLLIPAACKA